MSRRTYILSLMAMLFCSIAVVADINQTSETVCERFIRTRTLEDCQLCAQAQTETYIPDYYCACHLATKFVYGMDTVIKDTTWFGSTIEQVIYSGMTAYWFSTGSARIDIFTNCISQTPMMVMYVGSYRSASFNTEELQKKAEDYGYSLDKFSKMPVNIRVIPVGEGRILGYQYGEGFHSTCEDLFQVYYGMKYYHSNDTDVYELPASRIVPQLFVRWKQEDEDSVQVSMLNSCDGEPVQTMALADSMHLYFPDSVLLKQAKSENRSVFFRFTGKNKGRVEFILPTLFETADSLYQGCALPSFRGRKIQETCTIYDTTFLVTDTCLITKYNFVITGKQTVSQKVELLQSQLGNYKFNGWYTLKNWGNDWCEETDQETKCVTHYDLNVVRKWNYTTQRVDSSLCHGKIYVYGDRQITESRTWRDTVDINQDERKITIYEIEFTPPVAEHIEIDCESLPCTYKWNGRNYTFDEYGEHEISYTARNRCDEKAIVTVNEPVVTLQAEPQQSGWQVIPTIAAKGEQVSVIVPESGMLTVLDVLGRTVSSRQVEQGRTVLPLLQSGQYLVRLQTTTDRYNSRIIIQ